MRARDGNHHHHSHKKANNRIKTGAKITFYAVRPHHHSGEQLAKPSCGGSTPKDEDMIAAAPANSPAKCGDHVTIKHGSKEVTVKVIDTCEGCPKMGLDLSKGAFQKLATLDAGVIEGAQFWIN
ncbi:hypothetical protein IE81DRAFT_321743 [Ceraceosorus guamensis]|uniref:RlpA-like protein double-psi beta-barrel domain-containing protein n=1 Tax=Ceraceosorus guamensis TaxID=1522189 RepID=A0A316W5T0_9BASI|nr:hypothetical protein IE81DRAFT_321743 [Ceraceosorus guamensis]PWN44081.1 hypothetical protein IE81DRAFT_321743 [Ceraceosorus guamensis]